MLDYLIKGYLKKRIGRIQHYVDHPIEVQEKLLSDLLRTASKTEIGQIYRFNELKSGSDFGSRLPVVSYEEFKPYLQRVLKGESRVIWPSDIRWFAKSSGTTGDRSKFIPVSRETLLSSHYGVPRDLVCMYIHNNPGSRMFSGKSLIMGGSQKIHEENMQVSLGDISAVMTRNQPRLSSFLRAPSTSIALMEDWEEKIEAMAKKTISQKITSIGGVPTWTLVLIRRILEMTGKDHLGEVWPHLELYMHGGVSFEPYRQLFHQLVPLDSLKYYQSYNASEGYFGYQFENEADDMMLALDNGIYYEFIPQGHYRDDDPVTVGLDAVECGKHYAIVISTNSGLWRYKIGDTVQFTSTYPFRIKVSGRISHFVNAFGEEVIVDNADRAIEKACLVSGGHVREYTVAPIYFAAGERAAHQWLIEFDELPGDLAGFTCSLDKALQEINSDYEAKRSKGMALKMPAITMARKGLFYDWLKKNQRLGGQHKVPRLSNDRIYMDDLLKLNNSN